jgi:hypothetical protein
MKFENSITFARTMDRQDKLKQFRSLFNIPKLKAKPRFTLPETHSDFNPRPPKNLLRKNFMTGLPLAWRAPALPQTLVILS